MQAKRLYSSQNEPGPTKLTKETFANRANYQDNERQRKLFTKRLAKGLICLKEEEKENKDRQENRL